ncbi:MAG: hypothetical protein CL920_23740 [Deltaproteobacteria bacterium]|nr:hypothetical protein [Deltaproteobacteria bacterium]|tara:strand:- start:1274 stop:3172 length:1899 start_codon:yes stop_codon:yes gene_type:complete
MTESNRLKDEQQLENEKSLQAQWRFFILGFVFSMTLGVPLAMWGIYTLADNVTFLTFLRLLLIGLVVFVMVVLVWFRKWVFKTWNIPGKQSILELLKHLKNLLRAIQQEDVQGMKDESTLLAKSVIASYGWWVVVGVAISTVFGLVMAFGSLLNSALTWKGNSIAKIQNVKIQRQNELISQQNKNLILQLQSQREGNINSEVTKYIDMAFSGNREKFWVAVSYFKAFSETLQNSEKTISSKGKSKQKQKDAQDESRRRRVEAKSVLIRLTDMLQTIRGKASCRMLELMYHVAVKHDVSKLFRKLNAKKGIHTIRITNLDCSANHMRKNKEGKKAKGGGLNRSIDLRGIVLTNAILVNAKLKGADLRGANFEGANLQEADLERAYLQGANLQYTHLQKTNLQQANLQGAWLRKARFQRADLRRANLQDAQLQGAQLGRVPRKPVVVAISTKEPPRFTPYSERESDFEKEYVQGADLRGAKLERVDLSGANLKETDCRLANFRGAILTGVDFSNSQLQGAIFWENKLRKAVFKNAMLRGSTFSIDAIIFLLKSSGMQANQLGNAACIPGGGDSMESCFLWHNRGVKGIREVGSIPQSIPKGCPRVLDGPIISIRSNSRKNSLDGVCPRWTIKGK